MPEYVMAMSAEEMTEFLDGKPEVIIMDELAPNK